jgi:2,3-bisphosphoglycerate-dependent phosphoglycerate mutase
MISELNKNNLKIIKAWQLNERHYGSLTGLNKIDTRKKLGEGLFLKYRRSWDIAPPAIETKNIKKYNFTKSIIGLPKEKIPKTESLKDTYKRVIEFYKKSIVEFVFNKKTVVIAAHGNSLRALCKYLFNISDHDINYLEIPTGNPMVINFEENFNIKSAYYLDKSRAEKIVNIN